MKAHVLPEFGSLSLNENPAGWGPTDIPMEFKNMPFQPFSKDTRLGRVADWSGNIFQDMKTKGRYISPFVGSQYAYYHDEDDNNFQLVSSVRETKTPAIRQRYRFPMRGRRGVGGPLTGYSWVGGRSGYQMMGNQGGIINRKLRNASDRERMMLQNRRWQHWGPGGLGQRRGGAQGWRSNTGAWGSNSDRRQAHRAVRDASIQIKDNWTMLEELDFTRLSKLALPNVKEPDNKVDCGEMEYYDKSYDRVSTRNERPLVRVNRVLHTVTTSRDPVIHRLASDSVGKVYCTDTIAAMIMCCTRSVYPWDLIVRRIQDRLFFDKREDAESDFVSVCETAAEPPNEEPGHINSPQRLALEATFINTNLSQQMLLMGGKTYSFPEENPFKDDEDEDSDNPNPSHNRNREGGKEELGSVGYRYRVFDLGNDIQMVIRCEVNGVLQPTGDDASSSPQFVCIRALNEFDSRYCGGVDWRTKLDTQRGAVLAAEIKNNAFKLAGWTVCSILSGADQLKLGFVSRVNPRDSSRHVILGTQQFKPTEFANQLNLNMDNAWGILRCVVDFFMKMPEGKYLMLKDPNKPVLRIYSLPQDASDSDEDEENISEEEVAVVEQQNAEPSKTEVNNVLEHGQDNSKVQSRKVDAIYQSKTIENNKP
uniref:Eukaryotic translation initiation factor 3 subunit D n=1 Tax=Schistosoma japonicum TaxID=6182 RepID=C1L6M0_SCHJA|nr:eukaryotic translation initiation factor 3, subunit 7 zeta [Schistosoma japonicum]